MQRERFERKYFVSEQQALRIRDYIRGYLVPDEYAAGKPDFSYPVHSIYIDSRALDTYWATVHCEKSRFKLRVRFYDDNSMAPAFFEIKRRENECVLKQRSAVRREVAISLMSGHLPMMEHVLSKTAEALTSLQRFCYLMHRLHARPAMHIAYLREAWMSPHADSIRVTIDRFVRGEPWRDGPLQTQMRHPVYPFRKLHVLELKFTTRFPDWFNDLVQHFDLMQVGAPKYCGSIMLTGEERVINYNPAIEAVRPARPPQDVMISEIENYA